MPIGRWKAFFVLGLVTAWPMSPPAGARDQHEAGTLSAATAATPVASALARSVGGRFDLEGGIEAVGGTAISEDGSIEVRGGCWPILRHREPLFATGFESGGLDPWAAVVGDNQSTRFTIERPHGADR